MKLAAADLAELLERIERHIERVPFSGCWLWCGSTNQKGYGRIAFNGKARFAHRVVYQSVHGSVGGLTIDHLCRVRCCVNPAHMEAVTNKENILRGESPHAKNARLDRCKNGHIFDYTYIAKDGSTARRCITCRNEWSRNYRRGLSVSKSNENA